MNAGWHTPAAIALGIALTVPGTILLWRERARQLVTVLPLPSAVVRLATAPKPSPEVRNGPRAIVQRLIDELDNAELEVPKLHDPYVESMLGRIWRRHRSPFIGPTEGRAELVFQLGLTRPVTVERGARSRVVPDKKGQHDTRTFGITEGTIDQREVLFAPSPARFRFAISDRANWLRFAPAVLGEGRVRFEVALITRAHQQTLWSAEVRGPTERFVDLEIELPATSPDDFLELRTKAIDPGTLACFGSPELLAPLPAPIPYNVVLIVVDAMRPDAISAFHDPERDARMERAPLAPADAWLPRMPEVAPNLDRLAAQGVVFTRAWSAAMWTRPATLSLLTGQIPARMGLPVLKFEISDAEERHYYRNPPPLLPRLMRKRGVASIAIVNNMYLSGYYGVGVDTGFERLRDHRYLTRDTAAILDDAREALLRHRRERFFLFVNLNSPHAPYHPPDGDLAAIEVGEFCPKNRMIRRYLAEIHKDDRAIGALMESLTELGLLDQTVVVVTADHGETLSEAHDVVAVDVAQGVHSGRYTHLSTMWEETARIPILLRVPSGIGLRGRSEVRVQITDIMPTLLELEGLPVPPGLDGRSLLSALRGGDQTDRSLVIEGRGASSLLDGQFHLVRRTPIARRLQGVWGMVEKDYELYDLERDPGERRDLARIDPERVAVLARSLEHLRRGSLQASAPSAAPPERFSLRFVTGGRALPFSGVLSGPVEGVELVSVGFSELAVTRAPGELRVDGVTGRLPVGFDLVMSEAAAISWSFSIDGRPLGPNQVHAGSLGLVCPALLSGLGRAGACPSELEGPLPHLAASQEFGLFVVATATASQTVQPRRSAQAEAEARRAMQAWGYAKKNETEAR